MSDFDSGKDYYEILGADARASQRDIDRLYKQKASRHHPDRGGSEEEMKKLNEAYGVLKNEGVRRSYDQARTGPARPRPVPASAPAAGDIGLFGHGLSAFLCLMIGLFLLFLVRAQWIWFLWPLAILATFVIAFGVLMARSAMIAANMTLPSSHMLRRHTTLQEILFWLVVGSAGFGVYLLLTAVE
jgi:hypothetical protein